MAKPLSKKEVKQTAQKVTMLKQVQICAQSALDNEQDVKRHKISSGTYYRGMNLPFTPEQGKDFKFTFSGWTKSKKQAEKFGNILFMTKNIKPAFVDINSFGKAIQAYIKKEYPQYDWDAQSTIGKPEELSKLYTISDGMFKMENELVFEPHDAKIKNIKESPRGVYTIEV